MSSHACRFCKMIFTFYDLCMRSVTSNDSIVKSKGTVEATHTHSLLNNLPGCGAIFCGMGRYLMWNLSYHVWHLISMYQFRYIYLAAYRCVCVFRSFVQTSPFQFGSKWLFWSAFLCSQHMHFTTVTYALNLKDFATHRMKNRKRFVSVYRFSVPALFLSVSLNSSTLAGIYFDRNCIKDDFTISR